MLRGFMARLSLALVCVSLLAACGDRDRRMAIGPWDARVEGDGGALDPDAASSIDAGHGDDASTPDASTRDASTPDASTRDASAADASTRDASTSDASTRDAGHDAGPADAGRDASTGGGCISGATGTHAVRFEWTGSGSTAYVRYELNQLPDTSRWRVTSASTSIGYTPRYGDTFLGDGGLVLEGTAFIDVELSTSGLSSLRNVTLAIRGRSYNTTASGSFSWQTFEGMAATAPGSVYNSAPYQWYGADATPEFSAGDSGILLRIRAGPPSGSLIVNRVEICFDAS